MANKTLKEHCEQKRLLELHKKLSLIERDYKRFETLILEAVDMNQAVKLISQLKSIDFGNLNVLASARDAAVKDINAVIGGRQDKGVIRKLVGLFKRDEENPLIDVLGFAAALQQLFTDLEKYIDAHATKVDNADNMSVQELITGTSTDDATPAQALQNASPEARQALKDLQNFIVNDLKPSGALSKIGKSYVDKYMKNNIKGLAREIMTSNVKNILDVAGSVTDSLKTAPQIAQAAAGAEVTTKQTSPTTGTEQTKVSEPSGETRGTESTAGTAAPGEGTPTATKADTKKAYDAVYSMVKANQWDDQPFNPQLLKAMIDVLARKGMLK